MATFTTTAKTYPLSPDQISPNIGVNCSRGGLVTLDEFFTYNGGTQGEMSSLIHIGVGGNYVWVNIEGVAFPVFNAASGSFAPWKAVKILSSYNFPSPFGTVTTTASGLVWYGGQ